MLTPAPKPGARARSSCRVAAATFLVRILLAAVAARQAGAQRKDRPVPVGGVARGGPPEEAV